MSALRFRSRTQLRVSPSTRTRSFFSWAGLLACLGATSACCAGVDAHSDPSAASHVDPPPLLGQSCAGARFWTDGSTGRTWQQAREMCRSVGGDLASLHTEAERICANQTVALLGSPGVGAWIGLREGQQEGAWEWSDGSPTGFTAWLEGEPNDDSGGPTDCGHLWRERAFQWNDVPCTRTDLSFLCRLK